MTNVDLVALAASRGRISEAPTVDQVTAEVVRGAMETICFEMATYVSRTATTPILNQSNERNATVLDASGRLAALSVGIPQFMLTSTLPVRFALEYFRGDERLHPFGLGLTMAQIASIALFLVGCALWARQGQKHDHSQS